MLLIDKPIGISSFGIVAAVRRATGIKKVGHTGTLDPLATGLMLVLVGREETKQAQKLSGLDKSYDVVIRVGEQRDTGDLEGKIISRATNISIITHETIKNTINDMVGTLQLPVPAYSAIKRNGQRLYAKARKGHVVECPIRDMTVHSTEFVGMQEVLLWSDDGSECWRGYEVNAVFSVASGVYIRSLSEEFGRMLGQAGCGNSLSATTVKLRRIRIGEYGVCDAQSMDDVSSVAKLIHRNIGV
jgi:tRNA pseudouridine55 synthase